MSDNDHTGLSGGKDIPPWLQPVPEDDLEVSFWQARKTVIISAAAAVVLTVLFVTVLVYLYDDGSSGAPRHVAAPASDIRQKPDDPGGMQIDHQDKEIYNQIDGSQPRSEVSLGEQAEEPVALPEGPAEDTYAEEGVSSEVDSVLSAMQKTAPEVDPASEPAPEVIAEAKPKAPTPTVSEEKPVKAGYRVQFGAYGSVEGAEKAWGTIRRKFPNQLSGMEPNYEPVASGDRTLYRLRVGPLENRAAADKVCLALRAGEQACIVVNP